MLDVKGLRAGYGRIQALHGIDLAVARGELVALVGANGAGKTTLLKALSGIQGFSGSVKFEGEEIRQQAAEKRVALGIVHCPEGRQVFGPLSVEDNLRLGAYRRGRARSARSLERVYGLFPALASTRPDLVSALKGQAGQPSGPRAAARLRTALVTAQIALSMTLLISAGLFLKSLVNVSRVDLGVRIENLATFRISPELNGYDATRSRALFERVEDALSALPGGFCPGDGLSLKRISICTCAPSARWPDCGVCHASW